MAKDALPALLTADEAVRIGLERNPQIAAGLAGIASSAASYRALAALPSVQMGLTHIQGTSSAPTLTGETSDTQMDIGETLDTSGQRRFQAAGARAQWDMNRYQFEETKLSLTQQIQDAYWSLVTARAQTQIALLSLQDVERVHQLTRTQQEAGAAPRVDVIRSSIDVANAQQSYVTAQGAEQGALSALNALLARAPLASVQLADSLAETTAVPNILPGLPDLPELTRLGLANRPQLKAAHAQVGVTDYALKQARAARFPDLSVGYQRSLEQPVDSVAFGVSFPLLDLGSVRESIKSAAQAKKQAEAQLQQAEQQVRQQIAQAYTDFSQAQKLAAGYQKDILLPSIALLEMAQLGYKQGATGILPVIDAETTLRNARTGYINSLLALYKARDEVLAGTGGLTPPPPQHK
jgi:cobalt-zinc-cadmium efflux system outer membrane protein